MKAGYRHIKCHRYQIRSTQHDPHVAASAFPPLSHSIDVQLPLISMWVVRMRSPEKCMSSHFAARFHLLDSAAGDWVLVVHAG